MALGEVEAEDPEGEAVIYALVEGDTERFALDALSGKVSYIGPGEDYEAGPRRFELEIEANDGEGGKASTTVVVRVTDIGPGPVAADDEAETREDTPVSVTVLANDEIGDATSLRVVGVDAPEHGAAAVAEDGTVLFTPEADYHGPDRFIYTVANDLGLTAAATVMVTVLPANDAPEAVGTIPDQSIELGDGPATVDLGAFFRDVDGDALTYAAAVSEPVVTASVRGAALTLTAVRPGSASVTVTATDREGLTATQTFTAAGTDQRSRAVMEDTLAALGRGQLASARATLGRRVAAPAGEASRLTVAGQRVPLGLDEAAGAVARLARQQRFSSGGATEFLVAFGGQDEEAESGRRWTIWGQGDLQTFEGGSGAASFDGALSTAYLGVDTRLGGHWLAGFAVARSSGAGDWRSGAADGRLETTLTSVQPYLR